MPLALFLLIDMTLSTRRSDTATDMFSCIRNYEELAVVNCVTVTFYTVMVTRMVFKPVAL